MFSDWNRPHNIGDDDMMYFRIGDACRRGMEAAKNIGLAFVASIICLAVLSSWRIVEAQAIGVDTSELMEVAVRGVGMAVSGAMMSWVAWEILKLCWYGCRAKLGEKLEDILVWGGLDLKAWARLKAFDEKGEVRWSEMEQAAKGVLLEKEEFESLVAKAEAYDREHKADGSKEGLMDKKEDNSDD